MIAARHTGSNMVDTKNTAALMCHLSGFFALSNALQYRNAGVMKQIVFEPTIPTRESVIPKSSTKIEMRVVAARITEVNIRLSRFSEATLTSWPLITRTMVLFLQGNSWRGYAEISAIASASPPQRTATSVEIFGFESIDSRKFAFTEDPYVRYGPIKAGKNNKHPASSARSATVSSFFRVRSFISSPTKNMFWWHVKVKMKIGIFAIIARKLPVGHTLVDPRALSVSVKTIPIITIYVIPIMPHTFIIAVFETDLRKQNGIIAVDPARMTKARNEKKLMRFRTDGATLVMKEVIWLPYTWK
jgi:hypothetical protein